MLILDAETMNILINYPLMNRESDSLLQMTGIFALKTSTFMTASPPLQRETSYIFLFFIFYQEW